MNQAVNEIIENKLTMLNKRKKLNQSFDLFMIVNEILKKFNKESLEKRKCSNCSIPKFHLMKYICCKYFLCLTCFVNSCEFNNNSCAFCKKPISIPSREEGIDIMKNLILTVWRTMRVIDEEKERLLKQKICEVLDNKIKSCASSPYNLHSIAKYANLMANNILTMWRMMSVIDEEKERGLKKKFNEVFENHIQNCAPCPFTWHSISQYAKPDLTIPNDIAKLDDDEYYFEKYLIDPVSSNVFRTWIVSTALETTILTFLFEMFEVKSILILNPIRYSVLNWLIDQHRFYPTDPECYIPAKLFEKISFSMNEFAKFIITILNPFFGYLFKKELIHEGNKLVVTTITSCIVICVLSRIIKQLHSHVKKDQKYKFV